MISPSMKSSRSSLVTTNAQKTVEKTPMVSVTPKPLTGPVPNAIISDEVINVVTFASKIVESTFS